MSTDDGHSESTNELKPFDPYKPAYRTLTSCSDQSGIININKMPLNYVQLNEYHLLENILNDEFYSTWMLYDFILVSHGLTYG